MPSVARSVERPLDTHHACATGTAQVLFSPQMVKDVFAKMPIPFTLMSVTSKVSGGKKSTGRRACAGGVRPAP